MLKTLALILIAAAGIAFLSPYYTVRQLTDALENEDPQMVDHYVDFDAVRAYTQNDMAQRAGGDNQNGIAAAIGNLAGAAMGSAITPDTMVTVLKDKPRRDRMGFSASWRELIHRCNWISLDQFVVHNAEGRPTALLTRRGMTWEVTGLKF